MRGRRGGRACNLCAQSSINQTRVICYSSNFALSSIVQAVEQKHKYLLFSKVQWECGRGTVFSQQKQADRGWPWGERLRALLQDEGLSPSVRLSACSFTCLTWLTNGGLFMGLIPLASPAKGKNCKGQAKHSSCYSSSTA